MLFDLFSPSPQSVTSNSVYPSRWRKVSPHSFNLSHNPCPGFRRSLWPAFARPLSNCPRRTKCSAFRYIVYRNVCIHLPIDAGPALDFPLCLVACSFPRQNETLGQMHAATLAVVLILFELTQSLKSLKLGTLPIYPRNSAAAYAVNAIVSTSYSLLLASHFIHFANLTLG